MIINTLLAPARPDSYCVGARPLPTSRQDGETAHTLSSSVGAAVETLRRRFVHAQLYTALAADRCIPRASPERDLLLALDDMARYTIAPFAAGTFGGESASSPSIPGFLATAFGQSVLQPSPSSSSSSSSSSSVAGHKRENEGIAGNNIGADQMQKRMKM